MRWCIYILICCAACAYSHAQIRVVATVPNAGVLAREVGGDLVDVKVLAPPDRDAHYMEARPGMMSALRRADLLVAIGADLEIGWLPAVIRGANNRHIQVGQPAYFELASSMDLLEKGKPADRALGDVHPAGNPHVDYDPVRLGQAGMALAERWSLLYPEHADVFESNARDFADQAGEHVRRWKEKLIHPLPVLSYHADFVYLLDVLGVENLGTIEPLPGIPPTASHLRQLVHHLNGKQGVVWTTDYQSPQAGQFMARELNWRFVHLPIQAPMDGRAADYFAILEAWVDTLVQTE